MILSEQTDQLHNDLDGDWDYCYHEMHIHAIKLECELNQLKQFILNNAMELVDKDNTD